MSQNAKRESIVLEKEGQKIFGILHLPQTSQKSPVVLFCHGLGGNKAGRYRAYVDLSEALAQQGIASFRFDFRGSGDSEGTFLETTVQSQLSDALVCLDFLKTVPQIEASRIGLMGRSFGSVIAVLAANQHPVQSLCLWAPVFDATPWQHSASSLNDTPILLDGQLLGPPFYKEFSSLRMEEFLPRLHSIPLLLIQAANDKIIDSSHVQKYIQTRSHGAQETRLLCYPQSDHDFGPYEERHAAIAETTQWFKQTL